MSNYWSTDQMVVTASDCTETECIMSGTVSIYSKVLSM